MTESDVDNRRRLKQGIITGILNYRGQTGISRNGIGCVDRSRISSRAVARRGRIETARRNILSVRSRQFAGRDW